MYALAIRAAAAVETAVARNPALLTRLASKLNLKGAKASLQGILAAIKNSKALAAISLWEIGTEGVDILREWASSDKEMAEVAGVFGPEETKLSDTKNALDIVQYKDEVSDIHTAVIHYGGLEKFLRIRRALTIGEDSVKAYIQAKAMAAIVA